MLVSSVAQAQKLKPSQVRKIDRFDQKTVGLQLGGALLERHVAREQAKSAELKEQGKLTIGTGIYNESAAGNRALSWTAKNAKGETVLGGSINLMRGKGQPSGARRITSYNFLPAKETPKEPTAAELKAAEKARKQNSLRNSLIEMGAQGRRAAMGDFLGDRVYP